MSKKSEFKKVQTKIAGRLEGTEVPKEFQDKYGKRYTHETAMEAAGAITAEQGRRKLGQKEMAARSTAGRKRRRRKSRRSTRERYL
jgi:hypothetical protein